MADNSPADVEDTSLDFSTLIFLSPVLGAALVIAFARRYRRRLSMSRRNAHASTTQTETPQRAPGIVMNMDDLEQSISAAHLNMHLQCQQPRLQHPPKTHETLQVLVASEELSVDWTHFLGRGSVGAVYRGSWHGTPVAVKMLAGRAKSASLQMPPEGSHGSLGMSMSASAGVTVDTELGRLVLRDEAALLAQLRHPSICSFFGMLHFDDGAEAIVLEYLGGGTLHAVLHRTTTTGAGGRASGGSNLPTALACRIARETASGLAFLHTRGYVHRDIKSTNVLLDDQCHAKVADFGMATLCRSTGNAGGAGGAADGNVSTASSGQSGPAGTLRWMAPEVALAIDVDLPGTSNENGDGIRSCPQPPMHCEKIAPVGPASDVYSFGVLLWEILHEQLPFPDVSAYDAMRLAVRGERPSLRLAGERTRFAPVITTCWDHSPACRPAMAAVVQSLIDVIDAMGAETSAPLDEEGMANVVNLGGAHVRCYTQPTTSAAEPTIGGNHGEQ